MESGSASLQMRLILAKQSRYLSRSKTATLMIQKVQRTSFRFLLRHFAVRLVTKANKMDQILILVIKAMHRQAIMSRIVKSLKILLSKITAPKMNLIVVMLIFNRVKIQKVLEVAMKTTNPVIKIKSKRKQSQSKFSTQSGTNRNQRAKASDNSTKM